MKILLAAALLALTAAPALAQTREPSLTLYEQPGFKGRSVTLFADNLDLSDTGVVGRARSAQVFGRWRVCAQPGWRGRCQTLSRNIADLTALGMAGQVVSAALENSQGRESYESDPYAYDVEDYSGSSPAPPAFFPFQGAGPYAPAPRSHPSGPRPRSATPRAAPPRIATPRAAPPRAVAPRLGSITQRPIPAPKPRVYAAQPSVAAPAPVYVAPAPAPRAPPVYTQPDYSGGPAFGPPAR